MGTYAGEVTLSDNELIIDGHSIQLFAEKNPADLPWKKLNIDWVVESSGHFTHRDDALLHIKAGAKKVLITAPAHDEDVTIIPGVNDAAYDEKKDVHHVQRVACDASEVRRLEHNVFSVVTVTARSPGDNLRLGVRRRNTGSSCGSKRDTPFESSWRRAGISAGKCSVSSMDGWNVHRMS
jgi:hypothetical protein